MHAARTKASNEVILEGEDGAFGGIAVAVDAGRGELEVNFLFAGGTVSMLRSIRCQGDADGGAGASRWHRVWHEGIETRSGWQRLCGLFW
jgi:hypothetical protein